jgi:hypothetical protein
VNIVAKRSVRDKGFESLREALDALQVPIEAKIALVGLLVEFLNDEYALLMKITNDKDMSMSLRERANQLMFYLREISVMMDKFKEDSSNEKA